MKQLLDSVTIERPSSCHDCPFLSYDADSGYLCCGDMLPGYSYQADGKIATRCVVSPTDALEHNRECMFVKDEV